MLCGKFLADTSSAISESQSVSSSVALRSSVALGDSLRRVKDDDGAVLQRPVTPAARGSGGAAGTPGGSQGGGSGRAEREAQRMRAKAGRDAPSLELASLEYQKAFKTNKEIPRSPRARAR